MERSDVARPAIRRYALVAGPANFGGIEALVTEDDATQTARDLLASEGRFRLAIAALVVVVATLDAVVA
jgi:hypothetical protein